MTQAYWIALLVIVAIQCAAMVVGGCRIRPVFLMAAVPWAVAYVVWRLI